jgi:hypothetical protein
MMRHQTTIAGLLASAFVVPVFLGQGQGATLRDALSGTTRAIEVLKGLEQRLVEAPAETMGLIFSATELPAGDESQRDQKLESLRNEVNLLQMEYDSMTSPVLGVDGAVQSALGTHTSLESPQGAPQAGVTVGFDDSLRALLSQSPRTALLQESSPSRAPGTTGAPGNLEGAESAYSADPLRHGIALYRAGRYPEAHELLAPISDATAMYWLARTLERMERLDEAVTVMERALAKGGAGFEQRRAQTDLEFLRWKRDFMKSLPASAAGNAPR